MSVLSFFLRVIDLSIDPRKSLRDFSLINMSAKKETDTKMRTRSEWTENRNKAPFERRVLSLSLSLSFSSFLLFRDANTDPE